MPTLQVVVDEDLLDRIYAEYARRRKDDEKASVTKVCRDLIDAGLKTVTV